ncbi:MAG: GNAT family N-acetyltransferase [Chloroflexi bacterium]|nr:GNAT family N-acetyltransferase [Chloroflexota bacterium]
MKIAHVKQVETPAEWEAVKELRVRVFVHEQGCPLDEEFDEYDAAAIHAVALFDGRVVGTGRVYRNGAGETQIGRMAVEKSLRRGGVGGKLLSFLEEQARLMGVREVMLHAQTYVQSFYARHGYVAQGKPFDEAGIQHVRMAKRLD